MQINVFIHHLKLLRPWSCRTGINSHQIYLGSTKTRIWVLLLISPSNRQEKLVMLAMLNGPFTSLKTEVRMSANSFKKWPFTVGYND